MRKRTTLSELGVENSTEGIVLTALEAPLSRDRCVIAKLDLVKDGPDEAITRSAQTTVDGMYQIADNHPPGTELDPLRLD